MFHELGRCWLKVGMSEDPYDIMYPGAIDEIKDSEWMADNWEDRLVRLYGNYKYGYEPDYKMKL